MRCYAETAFLCSLHTPDAHTARALAWMQGQRDPLPFTGLHRLEFRNALRLRVFRKEIAPEQRELAFQAMLSDLASGVFVPREPAWPEVLMEAERLSGAHSEIIGTRSLDVLHVASALVLGARDFLTFNVRQGALASASGLRLTQV